MQSWANQEIEDMNLANTLQRVVVDALFSLGICKVSLATPAESAVAAFEVAAGGVMCERVDLDDFVFDVHARDFSEVSYIGHRYRVPLELVREDSKLYTKARKDLAPSTPSPYNLEGDERISTLGKGPYAGDSEEFEDLVDLWEIYLPRHKLVLTLADDNLSGATAQSGGVPLALREQSWLGPYCGPYHLLSYGLVPGNAMPKGPIQDLLDLHEAVNRSYRKVLRQTERQKEVMAVQGGATEDGSRIMEASDGDIIRVDNPEHPRPMVMGGANQAVLATAIHLKDLFGYMAGNLDMMGGLSPQSKTLGQDKLLAENASRAIADMQDRTITYTAKVIESMCWFWHNDPFKVMKSIYSPAGLPELAIVQQVGPEQRMALPFEELKVKIDPYSMAHATPQSRLGTLNQVVQQIILPALPLLQQQGVVFDMQAYLQKVASYADMPDLAELLTMAEPPQQDTTAGAERPGMAANTTRTYERQDTGPGRTKQGDDMNLVSTLLGADPGGASDQAA